MLGPVTFFASLHHRWLLRTCQAKSTNLQMTEQPQWIQLAADRLGSYRNIKTSTYFRLQVHQISVYFLLLKFHIPPALLQIISISFHPSVIVTQKSNPKIKRLCYTYREVPLESTYFLNMSFACWVQFSSFRLQAVPSRAARSSCLDTLFSSSHVCLLIKEPNWCRI